MCAPISVTTGGCTGVCQVMPQIIASTGIIGALIWNFWGSIMRCLGFGKASA